MISKSSAAFTLIEVIVTLLISSMILLGGVFSLKHLIASLSKNTSTFPNNAVIYANVRSLIASTYPYVVYATDDFQTYRYHYSFFYQGDAKKATFISASPIYSQVLSVVELTIQDEKLFYRESPLYATDANFLKPKIADDADTHTLFADLKNAAFSYENNQTITNETKETLPSQLILNFEKSGIEHKYIFHIQTDFLHNINYLRRQHENI